LRKDSPESKGGGSWFRNLLDGVVISKKSLQLVGKLRMARQKLRAILRPAFSLSREVTGNDLVDRPLSMGGAGVSIHHFSRY